MYHPIDALIDFLQTFRCPPGRRTCIGFDAAVDLLTRPVRRVGVDGEREHFTSISEFGRYLMERDGSSCVVDVSTIVEKPGGNMVNYAAALACLETPVDAVGSFGLPDVLPVYDAMPPLVTPHSVADSGRCFALEFQDGKVMLAQMDRVDALDYPALLDALGPDRLRTLFGEAALVGLVNWSEVQHSTQLWRGLLRDVFTAAPPDKTRTVLFDFTDCSRHPQDRVREALDLLPAFTRCRTTVLSLNRNEARHFGRLLELSAGDDEALAAALWKKSGCDLVVVHPNDCAVAARDGETVRSPGFFVEKPVLSTGGGDNFNAGLSLGLTGGLELPLALLLGNAVSGYYVRSGRSPSRAELAEFLVSQRDRWEGVAM